MCEQKLKKSEQNSNKTKEGFSNVNRYRLIKPSRDGDMRVQVQMVSKALASSDNVPRRSRNLLQEHGAACHNPAQAQRLPGGKVARGKYSHSYLHPHRERVDTEAAIQPLLPPRLPDPPHRYAE